eukprot:CAMPEP_0180124580 /NCGR_PEP_ID=MMETSP0986-20121125/4727_1 /TAXON_ID=697907 /ORGANISM="non described non described, Strain CCMP2293" /LENGTH=294 /DNA_ID=CAMNT_0022063929 /DNA_START=200 /DNA_END=1079 /DNA_ORIENTATION=-
MANLSSPLGTTLYHSPPLSRQRPISPLPLGNTLPLVSFRQILSSPLGSTSRQYPSSPLGNTSRCRCSIVSSFIISSESCYLGNTLPTLCLGNGQSPLLSGSATPYLASPPLTSRQHPTSPPLFSPLLSSPLLFSRQHPASQLNSATAHLSSQMIHKTPAAPASNNDPLLAEGAAHQTTLPVRKEPLTHDPSHAGGAAHSPNDTPLAGGAAPLKARPDPSLAEGAAPSRSDSPRAGDAAHSPNDPPHAGGATPEQSLSSPSRQNLSAGALGETSSLLSASANLSSRSASANLSSR